MKKIFALWMFIVFVLIFTPIICSKIMIDAKCNAEEFVPPKVVKNVEMTPVKDKDALADVLMATSVTTQTPITFQISRSGVANFSACTEESRLAIGFPVAIEPKYVREKDKLIWNNAVFTVEQVSKLPDKSIVVLCKDGEVNEKGWYQPKILTYKFSDVAIIIFPYHCVLGR